MELNGRDGERQRRPRLDSGSLGPAEAEGDPRGESDVVFDFSRLDSAHLTDLALILTARVTTVSSERVWARALPASIWHVLRALGLDHLFRIYPGPDSEPN